MEKARRKPNVICVFCLLASGHGTSSYWNPLTVRTTIRSEDMTEHKLEEVSHFTKTV